MTQETNQAWFKLPSYPLLLKVSTIYKCFLSAFSMHACSPPSSCTLFHQSLCPSLTVVTRFLQLQHPIKDVSKILITFACLRSWSTGSVLEAQITHWRVVRHFLGFLSKIIDTLFLLKRSWRRFLSYLKRMSSHSLTAVTQTPKP